MNDIPRKALRASAHMIHRARTLRRDSTIPEKVIWKRLRSRRCGQLKFRRQHPIGPYVADFFCQQLKLVVEIDGRSHDDTYIPDQVRQRYLEESGMEVIRFTNDRVIRDPNGVAESIWAWCEWKMRQFATPAEPPQPNQQ